MNVNVLFVNQFVHGELSAHNFINIINIIKDLSRGPLFFTIILMINYIIMLFHTVLNNKSTIKSEWLSDTIYNLADGTFKIPNLYSYEVIEVTEKYIARPDLLSIDIYGDSLYSDLLCKLNGISNPFELNKGMLLIIPSPDNIMDFMSNNTNKNNEFIDENDYNVASKPVPKTKKEKRKANEAVVGDTRFKIDSTKGIIIY